MRCNSHDVARASHNIVSAITINKIKEMEDQQSELLYRPVGYVELLGLFEKQYANDSAIVHIYPGSALDLERCSVAIDILVSTDRSLERYRCINFGWYVKGNNELVDCKTLEGLLKQQSLQNAIVLARELQKMRIKAELKENSFPISSQPELH